MALLDEVNTYNNSYGAAASILDVSWYPATSRLPCFNDWREFSFSHRFMEAEQGPVIKVSACL